MKSTQRGYVLMVVMVLLMSTGLGLFVASSGKSLLSRKAEKNRDVMVQLQNVKQRILAYSVMHFEVYRTAMAGPGFLPCPDTNKDGFQENNCNNLSIGWMPRLVVGQDVNFMAEALDPDRVLYVMDAKFANSATNDSSCQSNQSRHQTTGRCYPLNGDTPAERITLNDREGYVALLMYAGPNMNGQVRGDSTDIANYLEGENADNDGDFSTVQDVDSNDLILGITKDEWAEAIRARVAVDKCNGVTGSKAYYGDHNWANDTVVSTLCN